MDLEIFPPGVFVFGPFHVLLNDTNTNECSTAGEIDCEDQCTDAFITYSQNTDMDSARPGVSSPT